MTCFLCIGNLLISENMTVFHYTLLIVLLIFGSLLLVACCFFKNTALYKLCAVTTITHYALRIPHYAFISVQYDANQNGKEGAGGGGQAHGVEAGREEEGHEVGARYTD